MEENQNPPNATVTPLGKLRIDFSMLDEKLGEGVAVGILMMIRDAVAQEMHGRELLYEDKLPPGRPWLYYSAYDPNMDGEDMPHCLDLVFRPRKGMKFYGPELAFATYIFGNNLKLEEELVTNAHCDGTRKTLHTIMPGKPIIGDFAQCSLMSHSE
ncbi:hypothetical protein PIB30_051761 [Stylosanthes scabra]|uniref:Uncharacterized protein n=1 Tax=Stylosanthes scabra TaxID=79078 RepID=A0ABU6VJM7_9FABA|nr:hypothetical protein [Stylosanthes scabra]